jgi:hypothetical protein
MTEGEYPMAATYESAADLAAALRRAEAAHGVHEKQLGHADLDWPDWYAEFMVHEQSGPGGAAGSGGGA